MTDEAFFHNGRIIYAIIYTLEGGSELIVWLDRGGNDQNGRTCHSDPQRAIVTAKPGDVILYEGQPRTVVKVAPYRQNWVSAEDRAKYNRREAQPAEQPPT